MKAVIYARYSSDNQREESIEGQIRECEEYAERNGLKVLSCYIDRALSAKTDNRPEFQRMIRDSAGGLFDVVLVWKLDRFARNRYDSAHYKAILKKNGVNILDISQTIVQGFFNMMMIVDTGNVKSFESLSHELEQIGDEIGVTIKCQHEEIFDRMHRI